MSVLDDAYARLAPYDFVFAGGFSDHGPMVVVALTDSAVRTRWKRGSSTTFATSIRNVHG